MNKTTLIVLLILAPANAIAQWHGPAVPDSISFQGYLTDDGGVPIDAPTDMTFKLYKGTNVVWTQTQNGVEVVDGGFNVILGGAGAAALDTVAFNEAIELGVTISGNELSPRVPLTGAAYALGVRGLYAVTSDDGSNRSVNLIGGASNNFVGVDVEGATISGGGGWAGADSYADSVLGDWGTVSGGRANNAAGIYSTVGGGESNRSSGAWSVIGGGELNRTGSGWSTVAGGDENMATGTRSAIAGGWQNVASEFASSIGGGTGNMASGDRSAIGGGSDNTADGFKATIAGGSDNTASGTWPSIGGGSFNSATASRATVAGGSNNVASADWSSIGGGNENSAGGDWSTIGGGYLNLTSSTWSTVSGGRGNHANSSWSTVGGGRDNAASGIFSVIAGGVEDSTDGNFSTIGGGSSNLALGVATTVGGGKDNEASADSATVGGGSENIASGIASTIAGGGSSTASGPHSSIGGGYKNISTDDYTTVAGGSENRATQNYGTVGGGWVNWANAEYATVGGGYDNIVDGSVGTIPGGYQNAANGFTSFAAGYKARAIHEGTFVWSDRSVTVYPDFFESTAANQFLIRAAGGVGIGTTTTHPGLTISRDAQAPAYQLELRNVGSITQNNYDGIAFTQDATGATELASIKVNYRNNGRPDLRFSVRDAADALAIESGSGDVGIGTTAPSAELEVNGTIKATAVTETSDARMKRNVMPIRNATSTVQRLQGVTFEWDKEAWPRNSFGDGRQIGLIAQEVNEVVPEVVTVGDDGLYAVAYAKLVPLLIEAIKAQQVTIEQLQAENSAHSARIAALERSMTN